MKAQTKNLWAPLITPTRGKPWINTDCIALTQSDSKRRFLRGVILERQAQFLENVKFVKITITEQ